MITTFEIENTTYYTYKREREKFINGQKIKVYEWRGLGHIYEGATMQIFNTCKIKFKNYSEFAKFCKASKSGNSIKKYYMTKGGYCVVKKNTQEEIYIGYIISYETELKYYKAALEIKKEDLEYHEKNLNKDPEVQKYNIEYIQTLINIYFKTVNKYEDLIKEYNSKLQKLLKKED